MDHLQQTNNNNKQNTHQHQHNIAILLRCSSIPSLKACGVLASSCFFIMRKQAKTPPSTPSISPAPSPPPSPPSSLRNHGNAPASPLKLVLLACCVGLGLFAPLPSTGKPQFQAVTLEPQKSPINITSALELQAPKPKHYYNGTGGIFFCGFENHKMAWAFFPDFMSRWWGGLDSSSHDGMKSPHNKRFPNKNDILVLGLHSPCGGAVRQFPGKALFINAEPHGGALWPNVHLPGRKNPGDDVYQIGLLPDSEHSVLIYHGAWNLMRLDERVQTTLLDPALKPKNTGKYKGLMYMNGNCQQHREQAVNQIANIMTVWYGGRCRGNAQKEKDKFKPMPSVPAIRHWMYNRDTYSDYTFCMAMENSRTENYMSEKLVMAFLAGCIPIYYGSDEIFNVFNKDAFLFYDPYNPQPALAQLRLLASNETAYQEMQAQPILASGEQTVRDYFSVTDRIGGGHLKKKLRKVMGLPV